MSSASRIGSGLSAGAALVLTLFLLMPMAALVLRALPLPAESWFGPATRDALALSLLTAGLSAALTVLLGTPTAFLLARRNFHGRFLLDTLVDLPMVLPPAVAGLALLMAFGRRGLVGPALSALGIELPFTTAAVVMAETFVAAPFYIRAGRVGFAAVDPRLEQMSALLGVPTVHTFFRVTLPLAAPSLVSGLVMTWARALGEFGATIMFAGNFPGRTQTMPLAIYIGLESNLDSALALSVMLLAVSVAVIVLVRTLTRKGLAL